MLSLLLLAVGGSSGARAGELISFFGGERVGTSGGQFLRVPADARGIAMGGGMTAAVDGAASAFWNPAGMVTVQGSGRLLLTHTEYAADIDIEHLAYVQRIGAWRVALLGGVLRSGDILRTSEFHPDGQGHTFTANQFLGGVAVGRQLTDRFTVAATGKFLQENLDEYVNRRVFLDLGALYRVGFRTARIGFAVRNFGGDLRLNGDPPPEVGSSWQSYPAPTVAVFGAAYDFGRGDEGRLTLTFDFNHPSDEAESVILGAEAALLGRLFLRGGWRNNVEEGGLSAGFGLDLQRDRSLLRFSYAFDDRGPFGGIHVFSLELGR
jgi:hypothetical protein